MKKPKILLYDIETTPNVAYTWGKYDQDVLAFAKEWQLLSFAYKWLDSPRVDCVTKAKQPTDKTITKKLWSLLNEADIVIAHNGDYFDNKKASAKFLEHGLPPPSPYRSIDTVKIARRYFKLNSNKLDDVGKTLGLGRKIKHTGIDLWLGCMRDEPKAWALLEKYNKQDVLLLERVYERLKPWISNHPNVTLYAGKGNGCPKCGHARLKSEGLRYTQNAAYRRYRCLGCGGWCRERVMQPGVKAKAANI